MSFSRSSMHTYGVIIVFLGHVFFSSGIYASKSEDLAHYQEKLAELQKSISKIQQHLTGTKKKRSSVLSELNKLESEISSTALKLKSIENKLTAVKKKKSVLEQEIKQLNSQLSNQRAALSDQIRSAYSMGYQQNLKMLLNQQDPAQAGRTQQYFNYLHRSRGEQIHLFLDTLAMKQQAETALKQALNNQNELLSTQKLKKRKQQKQRLQRKKLLSELSKKIKNQESTLVNLEDSRNRIENLLLSLGELLADIPTNPSENRPFNSLKGHIPWPVKGDFLSRFGQPKNQGDLKWNGVLIEAKNGTPIQAVSHGRVAFSDWLQGYGFITIIDHGDGYMSLYGQSESLLTQTGDWVAAGDIIATTGDSGGQPLSGVYFEIRSRGKPVNPSDWCSSDAFYQQMQ